MSPRDRQRLGLEVGETRMAKRARDPLNNQTMLTCGREHSTIMLLGKVLMPIKWAGVSWQKIQSVYFLFHMISWDLESGFSRLHAPGVLEWVTLEFRGGGLGTIPAMALTSCMAFANPVLPLLSQVFCGLMLLIFFFSWIALICPSAWENIQNLSP